MVQEAYYMELQHVMFVIYVRITCQKSGITRIPQPLCFDIIKLLFLANVYNGLQVNIINGSPWNKLDLWVVKISENCLVHLKHKYAKGCTVDHALNMLNWQHNTCYSKQVLTHYCNNRNMINHLFAHTTMPTRISLSYN